ncbi:CRISPR-associated ring nuclease [Methanonatronarchaeum sp. AMET-Sl]|uniref:CRISPR-associated ring nuclease n=1 Tax=Methanonatronarchaeum sp. AMET-Sl TaxID=3037654 RepID=UPI00244DA721|nr:CRISPR-associated ring nuclease [Methanonatronarchaeum sp. AMET-Sl]WGI17159.1 CRISPR-associated ring nuclease [Methanonatronarchaeum sp. AMET-Sl]
MKCSLIGAMGTTAPVMTEMVKWLIESKEEYISDVVIFVTDEEEVKKHAELVISALNSSEWNIHSHWEELPFKDIQSEENNLEFIERVGDEIYKQKSKHDSDKIFLNVAGGRKTMAVGLHLLSQFNPVNSAYHVISPQISKLNIQLERQKDKIDEHFHSQNLDSYYKENKETFDPILFPDLSEFKVIEIPSIPFPSSTLDELKEVLTSDSRVKRKEVELTDNYLYRLHKKGLIKIKDNWLYPTSKGERIAKILK